MDMIPVLSLIFQHVRELIGISASPLAGGKSKLITPFPPSTFDFADLTQEFFDFSDPPQTGSEATLDTVRALHFYRAMDALYYDFSYGIRSEDSDLSSILRKFYLDTEITGESDAFRTDFEEKKDAFMNRYVRSTAGDLGNSDFRYTFASPLQWQSAKVVMSESDLASSKTRALEVIGDVDIENEYLNSVAERIAGMELESIEYELGHFDVIREWMDPKLLEGRGWKFRSEGEMLYGRDDPEFDGGLKLTFAERFYLVRHCAAKVKTAVAVPPTVRDHRLPAVEAGRQAIRRRKRNNFIAAVLKKSFSAAAIAAKPTEVPVREGFLWVEAAGGVPGHWERKRAGAAEAVPQAKDESFKIAAVRCRLIPQRPNGQTSEL